MCGRRVQMGHLIFEVLHPWLTTTEGYSGQYWHGEERREEE